MNTKIQKRKDFIINFLYVGIFVGLYYFLIKYALGYIFPFAFATALALLLQRPVRFISRKLHLKAHGAVSIILVLLIVVLVVSLLAFFGITLFNELRDFITFVFSSFSSVSELVTMVEEFVMGLVVKLPGSFSDTVGGYVKTFFDGLGTESSGIDLSALSASLSGAWDVVKGVPSNLLSVLITIISCVFVTADYDNIKSLILGMCTKPEREKLIKSKRTVMKGVSKLFKSYATLMLITFAEMFIGLTFMKLIGVYNGGYIAIISLVTSIVDIIPVLGTGTVLIPWALYNFIVGNIGFGIGLLVLYIVITVLRQVIEPKLVANQVGLPAIVTIMAMFIGTKLFGVLGVIILPLTVIIVKLMYDEGVIGDKKGIEEENSEAGDAEQVTEASVDENPCEEG